jgi:glycosyl transferase family WbsX
VPSMFIPCGSIGRDSRPWFAIGHGAPGDANTMKFTQGTTPALFRRHLLSLKRYIAQNRRLTKGLAILYAWNEWGEAAADIEPSAVGGYAYADVVREVFGLHSRADKPRPN